jgi:hypothetical protein
MVPTFTTHSIGQGDAQLYSGSIATATPQTSPWPPHRNAKPASELTPRHTAGITHCTPTHIHQI